MGQHIEPLSTEDQARVEKQRSWVRDHFAPDARHKYDVLDEKLRLLEVIIREQWIKPSETWKLQSLGIAFGDALSQKLGLPWVIVEDEHGRDPALQVSGTTILVYPLTSISKRIERGETVDIPQMFNGLCQMIEQARSKAQNN